VSELELNPRRSQLRVSHVWRDEVMADLVVSAEKAVTVGPRPGCTFTTPDLGLPGAFAIVRRGARGYLLTLGTSMAGRVKLGGEELDVAHFVERGTGERAGGSEGSFRAATIEPGDWGVIHLDRSGDHSIFFQFVKADPPLPGHGLGDSPLVVPALFFSVILHLALLIAAWRLWEGHSMVWPGNRELMADYLLVRPQPPPVPEPAASSAAGEEDASETAPPAATSGAEGTSGGQGEQPRARAPDPDKGRPDEPSRAPQVGLLSRRSRAEMRKVLDRGGFDEKLGSAVERLQGPRLAGSLGGSGAGAGTGVGGGAGTGSSTRGGGGTGGGGKSHADAVSHGPIDTGGTRSARGTPTGRGVKEAQVKVDVGAPDGELGGLTAAEILKVVKSRQNGIRSCYERALQRDKNLGGKIVVTWRINAEGKVLAARVRSTTMRNGAVEDCIVRQISGLKFPQPRGGQLAVVNFPFLFAAR
jgi:hypothetical protein